MMVQHEHDILAEVCGADTSRETSTVLSIIKRKRLKKNVPKKREKQNEYVAPPKPVIGYARMSPAMISRSHGEGPTKKAMEP